MPRALRPSEIRMDQIVRVNGERWKVEHLTENFAALQRYLSALLIPGRQPRCLAAPAASLILRINGACFEDVDGKPVDVVLLSNPLEN